MPIVKNRACKSSPNKALCYVTDPAKALLVFSRNLDDEISYARQFKNTTRLWNKAQTYDSRKYYHAILSFAREDNWKNGGNLTPEVAKEIAEQYAAYCWPGHEVVIAIHIDRGHIHAHFIINAVSIQTGKMLHINDKQYRREKDIANTLSKPHGLSTLDWRKAIQQRRQAEKDGSTKYAKTVAEQRIRERGGDTWKGELREIIDSVKEEADSRETFETLLAEQGVTLSRNTEVTISYVFGTHPAVRGNRLGDEYTVEAIEAALMANREEERKQRSELDKLIEGAERRGTEQIIPSGRRAEKSR